MDLNNLKKFGTYLKSSRKELILVFIIMCLNQACCLLLPTFMSKLIDIGIKQNGFESLDFHLESSKEIISFQTAYILKIGALMLVVALVSLLLTVWIFRIMGRISSKISMQLRNDLFCKIINFSYAQKSKFSVSYLITCLSNDVEHVQSFMIMCTQFIAPPLMLIGGIIMSLRICAAFTWIILAGGFIAGLIAFSCLSIITSRASVLQKTQDDFNLTIRQQLDGMIIIRGFNNAKFEEKRFERCNSKFTEISLFISKITAIMSPMLTIFSNFLAVLIIWLSALRVSSKMMEIGEVVAFMQYTLMIIGGVVAISLMISTVPQSVVSLKRVRKVLDCIQEDESGLKELPEEFKGKIQFENVSFKYDNLSNCSLKNINLTINAGEIIGITGTVGAGKSTLLKLLMGFYTPSEGEILFADYNLKDLKKTSILKNISYVSQKDNLFSGTIYDNLKFSNLKNDNFEDVLKLVCLDEFIEKDITKFNITNAGKNISGGQKQRLALARAILKESSIYVFDDSFSNLDFKTEFSVRNAILERLKGKTIILVSQRIGTIKNADKIVVMHEGKIIGVGTHEKLKSECLVYKDMVLKQECNEVQNGR